MSEHLFPYEWTLKDTIFTKDKGKVFSCFACGGGSTMGYKLAGFDVIGCNEIDPKMMACYIENHKPKYSFLEPIQTFKLRKDLPKELYELDILDGSPPCSSFSMVGNREKDWGKEKIFAEGQSLQVLDTLFFDFIELGKQLQPKVIIAENVEGLLQGAAKKYVIEINKHFEHAGYDIQHILLKAHKMGVPQKRRRVFFIAIRKDLVINFLGQKDLFNTSPHINLNFKEPHILFKEIQNELGKDISDFYLELWNKKVLTDKDFSDINNRVRNKPNTGFSQALIQKNEVCRTLTSQNDCIVKYDYPKFLSDDEKIKIGSFPLDYNFLSIAPSYLIGMSVPPVMTAQIATRIYNQWLSKL